MTRATQRWQRDAQRTPPKDDQDARHKVEALVTAIGELGAWKKDLNLDHLYRVPAETKAAVMQIVEHTKRRSGWRVYRTLAALSVRRSVYSARKNREDLQHRTGKPRRGYQVLPEERAAICEFALQYPKIGYRKLTCMMVDAETDCVGKSTVYSVLSDADLLLRWKRSTDSSGEYKLPTQGSESAMAYRRHVRGGGRTILLPRELLPVPMIEPPDSQWPGNRRAGPTAFSPLPLDSLIVSERGMK